MSTTWLAVSSTSSCPTRPPHLLISAQLPLPRSSENPLCATCVPPLVQLRVRISPLSLLSPQDNLLKLNKPDLTRADMGERCGSAPDSSDDIHHKSVSEVASDMRTWVTPAHIIAQIKATLL